jgi:type I restriction enzyme, S subunit
MIEDWVKCRFEDLLDYEQPTNYIVNSTEYDDSYETPVLTAGKSFIKGYTNEKDGIFDNFPTIIFDDFTTASQFVNFKFKVKSSAMKILVPTSNLINMKFVYYAMQVNKVRSDTHKRYWISIYSKKEIFIPSVNEQRAIVSKIEELFSDLDKGVADIKKAQDQLKVYRQAVLKKAFEGELTKDWREQQTDLPTADELLVQIKIGRQDFFDKQIEEWEFEVKKWKEEGENGKKPKKPRPLTIPDAPNGGHEERKWNIPENWIWTQIGDLCFVTKLAGFEYTDYVTYVEDGDLPVLKAENAQRNGFKKTDFSKVHSESVKMLTRSQIFGGELLIVFVGNVGNVAMVPYNQRYFLGPNVGMARPYFKLDSKYLELFLQSGVGRSLLMSAAKATSQPSLSMGTIRQAPVAFASLEEQHQIVQEIESRLSVCDKVEENITESLEKAKALRQSILKKAFEGNLLSTQEIEKCKVAADYQPAAVLLQKIKNL